MNKIVILMCILGTFLIGCSNLSQPKTIPLNSDIEEKEETTTFDEIQKKYPNTIHQLKETEDGKKDLEAEKEIKFIYESPL